jgi:acetyltransferase-like isoleucine patch superfamily enzyme/dTDP-4-dehydrorhamnose 3,5-epimerase-like enzyme
MSDGSVFVHENALLESDQVGGGTRVWAFAHVLPGARIGADCNICDHTFIENDVVIGDHVTIKPGVQLWDATRIEDDAFVGPNATFPNEPSPRSKQYLDEHPVTVVRRGASIGANATILPGLTIGQYAMVGAGAVVTRSVPPYAVVVGNPARITRYDGDVGSSRAGAPEGRQPLHPAIEVSGVSLHRVPRIDDLRGDLVAREVGAGFPFVPKRCFMVMDVRSKEVRGEHAHRRCEQLLVCAKGSMASVVDDGVHHQDVLLDASEVGLYVPPMVCTTQYKYTEDAILVVFASDPYDADDYIRDYDEFLAEVQSSRSPEPAA